MLLRVQEPLRITLELEPGSDPIPGRLYAHTRPAHRFYGWLEFAAAIEAACNEGSRDADRGERTRRS